MLDVLANKLAQHCHRCWVYSYAGLGSLFFYETQRVWWLDMPAFGSSREYSHVRVLFDDGLETSAIVLPHSDPCKSILAVFAPPPNVPLVSIFGLDVYVGNFDNLIVTYTTSSVRVPFLYILDDINKISFDFNLKGRINFSFLYVGFKNDAQNASIASQNNLFAYNNLPVMLKNADIEVLRISEYSDLRLLGLDKLAEIYMLKFDCALYNLTKIA